MEEDFNFYLEQMRKAVETPYYKVPKGLDTVEKMNDWIESLTEEDKCYD